MKSRTLALILVMLMIPCLAFAEETNSPERMYIHLVVDDEAVTPPGSTENGIGAYIINGVLYLPAGVIPASMGLEVSFDDETNTLYVNTKTETEAPSHCWVLTDVVHEVDENEQEGPRTWLYEYKDIENGGRYIIDYTWRYNDEYSHYTAIGELTNPPAYIQPDQLFILNFKVYNENVVGDRGWGIMHMGYIQYDSDANHYAGTQGFHNYENGEATSRSDTYNAQDGDRAWQMWARFPEGVAGETISFTGEFHRGNKSPIRTTWTYVWAD
jgi:hypothetical protein